MRLIEAMLLKAAHAWDSKRAPIPAANPPTDAHGHTDIEWRELWITDLSDALRADVLQLVNLLKQQSLSDGEIDASMESAESICRACSALRLFLRGHSLKNLSDSMLENGEVDLSSLSPLEATAFLAFCFLASLQTALIQAMVAEEFGDMDGTG